MPKRQIQVSLQPETIDALDAEAAATGRSRSYVAASRIEGLLVNKLILISRESLNEMILTNDDFESPSLEEAINNLRAALALFETQEAQGE